MLVFVAAPATAAPAATAPPVARVPLSQLPTPEDIQEAVARLPPIPTVPTNSAGISQDVLDDAMRRLDASKLTGLTVAENAKASGATGKTKRYVSSQDVLFACFLDSNMKNDDLRYFVEEIPNARGIPTPRFAVLCCGCSPHAYEQNKIMNSLLLQWWAEGMKDEKGKPHQPNMCGTYFRTLLATLKIMYGLPYSTSHFKSYDGSLYAVTKEFWATFVDNDNTFATKPNASQFSETDDRMCEERLQTMVSTHTLYVDPMVILRAFHFKVGKIFMLRGRKEHWNLQFDMFRIGFYPVGHPLSGLEFLMLNDKEMLGKTNRITLGMFVFVVV
jgi:hypothetical protein